MFSQLSRITDSRKQPQIPTFTIAVSVLAMHLARLGSLNSLEQLKDSFALRKLVGADLPSADSLGRVVGLMDADSIRAVIHSVYMQLKRNKALQPPAHGLMVLAIDGHETYATYRRCCPECLERKVGAGEEKRIQYYHRNVTAQLIADGFHFMLDAESQLPSEGEVTTGMRLLERVLISYPRAFDVVVADALYAKSNFIKIATEKKKDVIVVLKENCPELLADATRCFDAQPPSSSWETGKKKIECWDESGFASGPQIGQPLRIVKAHETKAPVRRQLDKAVEIETTTWMWMTTLSPHRAKASAVVPMGHSRWCVENEGFNELVNRQHADHVYKHDPTAILNFWLINLLSFNLFLAFFKLNLKPEIRHGKTMQHFARTISAELYSSLPIVAGVPP
ncbi:MAG: transposase [Nitrososphaerales archaeon]